MSIRFTLSVMAAAMGLVAAIPVQAGWIDQSSGSGTGLEDVRMTDTSTGFAVGSGLILKTTNGTSWSAIRHPVSVTTPFYDVAAINATAGTRVYVSGKNTILYAPDGANFEDVSPAGLSLDGDALLYGIDTPQVSASGNGGTAYIVGKKGTSPMVLKTTTYGSSWITLTGNLPPGTPPLYDIDCVSTLICFAVGENGSIVKTTTGGTSWSTLVSGTTADLRSITAVDSTHAWVSGTGGVIRVTSNGSSWTGQTSDVAASTTLNAISFADMSHGMAVGSLGNATQTSNGSAWKNATVPGAASLGGVQLLNSTTGWAVGSGGKIFRFDGTGPTVGAVTPTTATSGTAATFSASYADNLGVASCDLYVDSVLVGAMTLSAPGSTSGTASRSHTFASTGSTALQVRCTDTASNLTAGAATTITVTTANRVPAVPTALAQYDNAAGGAEAVGFTSADSSITFKGLVSDPDGDTVRLYVEFQPVGTAFTNMPFGGSTLTASGTTATTITFSGWPNGAYHWQARATDSHGASSAWVPFGGNAESAADFTIAISGPPAVNNPPNPPAELTQHDSAISTIPGEITSVTPAQGAGYVDDDGAVTLRVLASDPDGGTLRLDVEMRPLGTAFTNVATQTDTGASGTALYGIPTGLANGAYHWQARVVDTAGAASAWVPFGANAESAVDFTVSRPVSGVTFPTGFAAGDLVKLPNDGNPNTFGDTAVFYLGADGNRYVFTNDKAYFTWYANFNAIRTISTTDLAAIPLRGNVTYRPGVKMVKLQTSPTVYVVTARGVLRAVPSEAIAAALYGSNWNQQIDDINDAFWTNYTVGASLTTASDFDRTAATNAATSISVDKGL